MVLMINGFVEKVKSHGHGRNKNDGEDAFFWDDRRELRVFLF